VEDLEADPKAAGLAGDHLADLAEDLEEDSEAEILGDPCKNMMPHVLNAEKNASFLSGRQEESLFYAAIASGKAGMQETHQEVCPLNREFPQTR